MIPKLFRNNIATFDGPTLGTATMATIDVTGTITWYKDGEFGVAYKKTSASSWNHVAQDSKSIDATIPDLEANTSYDVCLYVKIGGKYQYSEKATKKTAAS